LAPALRQTLEALQTLVSLELLADASGTRGGMHDE
jgi:hypothetical protein